MSEDIVILGAREHNLRNLDIRIPRNSLVVITGLSGSGKSSLAFDTIYSEGQRRYMETFSSYVRQFLGTMERPDVDSIEGLSPVIAIEQKTTNRNPRSTVGTVTEIYDFLRLLFARVSTAYSLNTGEEMISYTDDEILQKILKKYMGKRIAILGPAIRSRKGHYRELFETFAKQGYLKARVDNEWMDIVRNMRLDRYKTHDIEIVVDRIDITKNIEDRLKKSILLAMRIGKGSIIISDYESSNSVNFSRNLMCPTTGISYLEPEPNSFSFNSPKGACIKCDGIGRVQVVDLLKVISNSKKSLKNGALKPLGEYRKSWIFQQMEYLGLRFNFDLDTPWGKISAQGKSAILNGHKEKFQIDNKTIGVTRKINIDYEGIINFIQTQKLESKSKSLQRWADEFMIEEVCDSCNGARLKNESLNFKIESKSIADLTQISIGELQQWAETILSKLDDSKKPIGSEIIKELKVRIKFLTDVGLHYLSLNRSSRSLSGGEAQRIRLATQIGSQLVNVLYILDEPSIGLHQRDNQKLINSLENLRDIGNSVIVVEHDEDMMKSADHIIDLGPNAGIHGGEIMAQGNYLTISKSKSLTGKFLRNELKMSIPKRRIGNGKYIHITGANGNNLKNVDLEIPLGVLTVVTGVSGSGKSTLINSTLYPAIAGPLHGLLQVPEPHKCLKGIEYIDKVIDVDQSPIGRTPRSNPATYTNVFNDIRKLFSDIPEAKIRGYAPGRFSFNVKGGRCETCQGGGMKTIEMNFLPDVYVPCETCQGKRFNRETLEIRYKGKSISDILSLSISDAYVFFESIPKIHRVLKTLTDVGLGYITLGQPSTTLSGGEAQRIKLATELCKRDTGKTLYILDEPTTGLHFEDIRILMKVINELVDKGNTAIIIEHNIDVMLQGDNIIDLGPDGGEAGGKIVASGTPEVVSKSPESITAPFLKESLKKSLN
tara:strand:- start:782 stop:3607 length:2826 start_codon:yes stop_codon:yes gene_type:complete